MAMPSPMRGFISGAGMLLLALIAIGGFVGYLYWLGEAEITLPPPEAEKRVESEKRSSVEAIKEQIEDQFQFDFFSMLPQEEYSGVEERPPELQQQKRKTEEKRKGVASAAKGKYLIQLGAFRKQDAADRHKAELLLMGVEQVQIERVETAKGALYRVSVGPFHSFSNAEQQQEVLNKAGYNSFLKKMVSSAR